MSKFIQVAMVSAVALLNAAVFNAAFSAEKEAQLEAPEPAGYFRYSIHNSQEKILSACVATRIESNFVVTAAHCVSQEVSGIRITCPHDNSASASYNVSVEQVRIHPSYDLALLELDTIPDCLGLPVTLASQSADAPELFSWTLAHNKNAGHVNALPPSNSLSANSGFGFELLEQNQHTFLLQDSTACLQPGDSGFPIFTAGRSGDLSLAGILIGGTEGCPALQSVVQTHNILHWVEQIVENTQSEIQETIGEFCSVELAQSVGAATLSNNLRLSLPLSEFHVKNGKINLPDWLELQSKFELWRFKAQQVQELVYLKRDVGSSSVVDRVEVRADYLSETGQKFRLAFRTKREANNVFAKLNSSDAATFYAQGQNLRILASRSNNAFADFNKSVLVFAPCEFATQNSDEFKFELAEGTTVNARVKAFQGSYEIAHYVGKLTDATIDFSNDSADHQVLINNGYDLDFLGNSLTVGQAAVPGLVIRMPERNNSCGFVFDISSRGSNRAVKGYTAYNLECDDSVGERLDLHAVDYPARYRLD